MKFIIAGSRSIIDEAGYKALEDLIERNQLKDRISEVVCGMARGVDEMGYCWAKKNGKKIKEFPAKWDTYGRSAGHRRNKEMAEYADGLILLWDGVSRGSLSMLEYALDNELEVYSANLGPVVEQDTVCFLPWAQDAEIKTIVCTCGETHSNEEITDNTCANCSKIISLAKAAEKSNGPSALVANSRLCPTCGNIMTDDEINIMCVECGTKLNHETVSEEIVLGSIEIRSQFEDETHERIHFVKSCEFCGEELINGACGCEAYTGIKSKKEKRPELNKETYIPSNLTAHARGCRCDSCAKEEEETIKKFGCKNPL